MEANALLSQEAEELRSQTGNEQRVYTMVFMSAKVMLKHGQKLRRYPASGSAVHMTDREDLHYIQEVLRNAHEVTMYIKSEREGKIKSETFKTAPVTKNADTGFCKSVEETMPGFIHALQQYGRDILPEDPVWDTTAEGLEMDPEIEED